MIKVVRTFLLCFAIAGIGVRPALAAPAASEYEVKAAFLYNFIKFVEWPQKSNDTPIVIGVLADDDPFFDSEASVNYLDHAVSGKTINDRNLVIKRSSRVANLKDCHLLFIPKSERKRIKDILESLKGLNILTVSETENFCQQGGMINFIMESEKVRFEINADAAGKAGLKISSKLLNVAKLVSAQPR
jgi:hypothetical protein